MIFMQRCTVYFDRKALQKLHTALGSSNFQKNMVKDDLKGENCVIFGPTLKFRKFI